MKQQFVLALALSLAIVGLNLRAEDDKKGDKPATIKAVMKAHKKGGARDETKDAVKAKDWVTAGKSVKDWVKLAEDLGKNKPKKGSKESWEKLTGTYEKTVKTLAAAIKEKNAPKANGALGKIAMSCGTCHKAHK